jgi:hypothetical protein
MLLPVAETQYSIRLVKTFPYRGDPVKQFSNRYYFDGGSPGDDSAWHALMDAWVGAEAGVHWTSVHIVEAYGYAPGSKVAVASKAYTQAGGMSSAGAEVMPGDCAAVLRQATTKRSIKNHPVYVFSYFHAVARALSPTTPDTLFGPSLTAYDSYGAALMNGITVGGRTYKRTTPDGHAVTGHLVDGFIGHRDFPR